MIKSSDKSALFAVVDRMHGQDVKIEVLKCFDDPKHRFYGLL